MMDTEIIATCPKCGELPPLKASQVTLDINRSGCAGVVLWYCTRCRQNRSTPVNRTKLVELLEAGVIIAVGHPENPDRSAPAFTLDDLLDFHEDLERYL